MCETSSKVPYKILQPNIFESSHTKELHKSRQYQYKTSMVHKNDNKGIAEEIGKDSVGKKGI